MKEDLECEIWKDAVGYEGLYQVSNIGRVYAMPKKWSFGSNGSINEHEGKILNQYSHSYGYKTVTLRKDKIPKSYSVHVLVAQAFLEHTPCGFKLVVDHINNNPTDNRAENLQVVTHRFNVYKTKEQCSSKYKGVSFYKKSGKWMSRITINGKLKYLGIFDCELKAYSVYQNALKDLA
jgi:hypothetical protein